MLKCFYSDLLKEESFSEFLPLNLSLIVQNDFVTPKLVWTSIKSAKKMQPTTFSTLELKIDFICKSDTLYVWVYEGAEVCYVLSCFLFDFFVEKTQTLIIVDTSQDIDLILMLISTL